MKTTPRKGTGQARRPTASADRPAEDIHDRVAEEPRCYAAPQAPAEATRGGLFTGGATLH